MKDFFIPVGEISSEIIDVYLRHLSKRENDFTEKIKKIEVVIADRDALIRDLEARILSKDNEIAELRQRTKTIRPISDGRLTDNGNGTVSDNKIKTIRSTFDGRFTDNDDGTVSDNKTGLMWKKYPEGLSGKGCSPGTAEKFTWNDAMQRAQEINSGAGYAGYHDWRLPDIEELESIVNRNTQKSVINQTAFPNSPADYFWSSSSPVGSMGYSNAWLLGFINGDCCCGGKNYSSYVRLVRGGK